MPPDDAARLPRLRRLAALKKGRARNQPIRIVWHDTPDAELLDNGLAAAEQRGHWSLEQVGPNGREWPIGAPAPVIAEAVSAGALEPPPPERLMPIAAFDGRTISMDVLHEGEALSICLFAGVLRGVTAEQRSARMRIAGSGPAVIEFALGLADELPVGIPRAALATEAIAAARAESPRPRRTGAPTLSRELSVPAAFAHLTGHLADVILHWGGLIERGADTLEPVHQMRVAMRRLRSAISKFPAAEDTSALASVSNALKGLSSVLGPARDWDVFCSETGRAVRDTFAAQVQITRLLAAADRRRAEHHRALRAYLAGAEYRKLMIRLAGFALPESWETAAGAEAETLRLQPLAQFAASVLDRRLRRLLTAGEAIEHLEAEALHEIRLRGKRMRYAAELFGSPWQGRGQRRFIRRLAALQESLGVLNDGAVATGLMSELAGGRADRAFAVGIVRGFVAGRGVAEREEIADAWDRFRRIEPFWS